jgi:hypothetical protein
MISVPDLDWLAIEQQVSDQGFALTLPLLTVAECAQLRGLFEDDGAFRRRINMDRHSFGSGDYGYFADPLPAIVCDLRRDLFAGLSPIANRMAIALRREMVFPAAIEEYR